jgi:hypothetical protein
MPRKYDGLTAAEHDNLGSQIQDMRDAMVKIEVLISTRYGKGKKVTALAYRAHDAVEKLRCELDNIVCSEGRGDIDTYYRAGKRRRQLAASEVLQ